MFRDIFKFNLKIIKLNFIKFTLQRFETTNNEVIVKFCRATIYTS